ncbi:MAG: hypothetical protein IH849_14505 [Acidobacteria bacterium]|nr:hypothetical protein [Acidobacteriota bacterium]
MIATTAVVAQALASKITNTEAISQDARSGERYHRTRQALTGLEKTQAQVRGETPEAGSAAIR